MSISRWSLLVVFTFLLHSSTIMAEDLQVQLRSLRGSYDKPERPVQTESWKLQETAVIVCDVWDLHHCLNAVRRLEEFAPRLDVVLKTARQKGATIIHSPSDCMPAYADHLARRRAQAVPVAAKLPHDIKSWCSKIPAEELAIYPIDQSDGGEDDDPTEHAAWAEKLKAQGRNPGMPWKKQSDLITIDAERDFISDKGDEVWNILQARGIKHVILTGVHTNMCVLGRPFGLRQMVRNGMQVALMRDMTDCMYNPKRWPYVNHFTGNDYIIAHVERFICPTITSDQVLGGKPFRSKHDTREQTDLIPAPQQELVPRRRPPVDRAKLSQDWTVISLPNSWAAVTGGDQIWYAGVAWYRCAVRLPADWLGSDGKATLRLVQPAEYVSVWWNGQQLKRSPETKEYEVPRSAIEVNDANLLVVRDTFGASGHAMVSKVPTITAAGGLLELSGRWQVRWGDDPTWSGIPLPARYGASPDIVFEPTVR